MGFGSPGSNTIPESLASAARAALRFHADKVNHADSADHVNLADFADIADMESLQQISQ